MNFDSCSALWLMEWYDDIQPNARHTYTLTCIRSSYELFRCCRCVSVRCAGIIIRNDGDAVPLALLDFARVHSLPIHTHTHARIQNDDDENSNYQQIQSLAFDQHEIATETISLQQGLQDKGYEEWVGEMIGMREILRHFANVTTNDVVGMRAPYLKPGRNAQYKVRIFSCTISIISRGCCCRPNRPHRWQQR